MADVLYLEHHYDPKTIETRLNDVGIDVETVFIENQRSLVKTFNETYKERLSDYKVVIIHGGVYFQNSLNYISNEHPETSFVLLTPNSPNFRMQEGNFFACDYDDEMLISFVKEGLERKIRGS